MGYEWITSLIRFTRPERLSTWLCIILWGMLVGQKGASRVDDTLPWTRGSLPRMLSSSEGRQARQESLFSQQGNSGLPRARPQSRVRGKRTQSPDFLIKSYTSFSATVPTAAQTRGCTHTLCKAANGVLSSPKLWVHLSDPRKKLQHPWPGHESTGDGLYPCYCKLYQQQFPAHRIVSDAMQGLETPGKLIRPSQSLTFNGPETAKPLFPVPTQNLHESKGREKPVRPPGHRVRGDQPALQTTTDQGSAAEAGVYCG